MNLLLFFYILSINLTKQRNSMSFFPDQLRAEIQAQCDKVLSEMLNDS